MLLTLKSGSGRGLGNLGSKLGEYEREKLISKIREVWQRQTGEQKKDGVKFKEVENA